jgi:hypothetical protein
MEVGRRKNAAWRVFCWFGKHLRVLYTKFLSYSAKELFRNVTALPASTIERDEQAWRSVGSLPLKESPAGIAAAGRFRRMPRVFGYEARRFTIVIEAGIVEIGEHQCREKEARLAKSAVLHYDTFLSPDSTLTESLYAVCQ